jgi:hypothetical protein
VIDAIAFRKEQRCLVVMVHYNRQRVVWAPGDGTCGDPFDELVAERSAATTNVSADASSRIANVVAAAVPRRSADSIPFTWSNWAFRCRLEAFVAVADRFEPLQARATGILTEYTRELALARPNLPS